jgi:hypothetical protein
MHPSPPASTHDPASTPVTQAQAKNEVHAELMVVIVEAQLDCAHD